MKKIIVLVFAVLALVACGGDTFKPNELEAPPQFTVIEKDGASSIFLVDKQSLDKPYHNYGTPVEINGDPVRITGIKKEDILGSSSYIISTLPTVATVTHEDDPHNGPDDVPITFLLNEVDNTYDITFPELVGNVANPIYYVIIHVPYVRYSRKVDEDLISVSKPTFQGKFGPEIKHEIPNYKKPDLTATPPRPFSSHIVYLTMAVDKDSSVFWTLSTISADEGVITIPATDNPEAVGVPYKIWTITEKK